MNDKNFPLPTDLAEAHTLILALRQTAAAEARAQAAESKAKYRALLIEKLKYTIAKLRHGRFGQSSERSAVLEQLELQLSELEEDASEAEAAAEVAAEPAKVEVRPFARRKPARRPLPGHLPREKVIYPVPQACPCCGGTLHKLGEDPSASLRAGVTETLELIPRQWKVIQHVREKYSCRSAAGAVAPDRARPGRPQAAGACAVRQVRPAPAADAAERDLRPRGHRPGRLDAGRPSTGSGGSAPRR